MRFGNVISWIIPLLFVVLLQGWAQKGLVRDVAAPSIQGQRVEGRPFEGLSFEKKPLLIYFWGSWCGICKSMQDTMNRLGKDVSVLSVALSSGDAETVRGYMEAGGFKLPTVIDSDGKIAADYGVHGVPALFFVDGQGKIRQVTTGFTTELGIRLRLWWVGRFSS